MGCVRGWYGRPLHSRLLEFGRCTGDIDLGRANLPAGGQTVVKGIEMKQTFGRRLNGEDVFGTGPFAGAAPHAFFLVHDGKPFRPYFESVKKTGLSHSRRNRGSPCHIHVSPHPASSGRGMKGCPRKDTERLHDLRPCRGLRRWMLPQDFRPCP